MSLSAEEKKRVAKLVCRSYYHRTRYQFGSSGIHFYRSASDSPSGVLRIGGCPDTPEYRGFINKVKEHINKGN